jgi:hypothetical protein
LDIIGGGWAGDADPGTGGSFDVSPSGWFSSSSNVGGANSVGTW